MRTHATRFIGLVTVATALLGGCGDSSNNDNNNNNRLSVGCAPNTRECVGDRVARICPADGAGWIVIQCGSDETCQSGACAPSGKPVACTAADNGCTDATTAMRCSASGAGFDSVTCPSGTACVGAGLCEGACVVGSSICTDASTIATCADGKTYTIASCGAGEACVRTAEGPVVTSACKKSDCTPDASGCDAVCGNKVDPMAANQAGTVSVCTETPNGYKWIPTTCAAPKSCSPSAGSCAGGTQAACASECTPGDQRCTTLAGFATGQGTGYQTCGADGKWGTAVTACNAAATSFSLLCFPSTDGHHALCGDFACAVDVGACDGQGLFHACDASGKLAATGTACQGNCVSNIGGDTFPGLPPGHCVAECEPGDERCGVNGNYAQTYQVCGADKKWGAVAACPGNDFCQQTQNAAGRPRKFCGECVPGDALCTDSMGNGAGGGGAYVRTCDATAHFGDPVACAVGRCQYNGNDGAATCVADCFPGAAVCIGYSKNVDGTVYIGTDEVGTCSTDGHIPDPGSGTACPGVEVCRQHANGTGSVGCTVCVGSNNEYGLADSRCADTNGDPGGDYLQTCKADGSGWDPAVLACGGANPRCNPPSTNISASGAYCHSFGPFAEATQSALQSFGASCASLPVPGVKICGSLYTGTVADCCAMYCYADPQPYSAFCGPNET